MQAVAAAAGGASLQHGSGLQHRAMQHSMMTTGAQVPAASSQGAYEERGAGGHYYEAGDREMASPGPGDSPTYTAGDRYHSHGYTERPEDTERETSASGSASCEDEDDERDYDGKRSGDPLSGLAAKKRRKQSKPIRLGSDEEGAEGEAGVEVTEEAEEEGEVTRYRRVSGDSGEAVTSPMGPGGQEEGDTGDTGDTPLNLSAVSRESGERAEPGGLRVLGRELLQSPEKEGFNTKQSSDAPSVFPSNAFGGMQHFMFPFSGMGPIPTSSSLSMSRADLEGGFTPTSSSGGQIQIFNIEAYCKLCNKEFCNKYFLKTHLANKHGIYSDNSSNAVSSGQAAGPRFDGGSLYDKPPMKFPGSSPSPVSISGSFMAMSSPKTSGGGLLRESPGERPQSHTEMRSPLPSPIRPHSTGAGERSTPGSQQSPKPGPPPLIPGRPGSGLGPRPEENGDRETGPEDLKRMDKELMRPGLDMGSLPSGIRLPMVPSMSPFGGPMHFDNLLKMSPLSPMDQMRKEAEMENDLDKNNRPIPNVPNVPGKGSEGGSGGQNGNMTPDRLRQMGVINADAFCEFCCKEFCNKYFLRVHKLKKHGVCSPELPPEKVQKILQQMAKEAGKTGQPMPPLTMGAPSAVRPPGSLAEPPRSMSGAMGPMGGPFGSMGSLGSMGGPLNLIRPPHLPNFLNLPGLEPGSGPQVSREDSHSQSSSSSDKQEGDREDREAGRPLNFSASSPRSSLIEPECELKIDENAPVIESPARKDPEDLSEAAEDQEMTGGQRPAEEDQREGEASEGLANLQNMIMKLHGRTMMGQEPRDTGSKSPVPVSLPQYPADLSKMGEKQQPGFSPGLNIPNPLLSRQPSLHSLANGFPKLSDKGPSIFEQMQGLPRPSFMDQIKKDLGGGGGGIDIPLSPMKRPSLDRDPNKKPASLSRSYCEICKKELCNKYFMKTHMMKMHGIMMEDGPPKNNVMPSLDSDHLKARLPPHMRDNGLMGGMFPGLPGSGEFPAPPPLGEFSRLLMQQGEKNLERQKAEQERREREAGPGHVCSLCSNTFPDIIALQVHIIKSHGALPPTTGLDGLFGARQETDRDEDKEAETRDDIAENEEKETEEQEERSSSPGAAPAMFPFPMAGLAGQGEGEASKNLQELMARQLQFPGMINPLMGLPMAGLAGAGAAPNSQFQGLFNMFLSEMLKKVQKDTPPQTPPSSPPPQEDSCLEEEARS